MPIEILQSSQPIEADGLVEFNFNNPVIDWAFGFSFFRVTYGTEHHWVRSLMINMLPVASPAVAAGSKQVSAQVQIEMQDDSGHSATLGESVIIPVCIAVTKSPQPNTVVASYNGIPNGSSRDVQIPNKQSGYSISTCFQSGFNLSFTSADHQLLQARVGCGIGHAGGQTGQVSASANLEDGSGNVAQTATVDAGYLVSSSASPGIDSAHAKGQSMIDTVEVTLTNLTSISAAVAVIGSWRIQCPAVKDVKMIQVGVEGGLGIQGNVVKIPKLYAVMTDGSGYQQDNAKSSCEVQVLAVP